ncbi:histidinol-phosphatase [Magnaporthiopsis poae ATCC 64411]|uniref:Histidinol-phosphatase n=1 Tax=Magnaporthiopsis poae (strain ATCC 64411 / 73-15) TaxID=644358 RepID=A0A0C4DMM9_MAGP6|nr:histidinol-phosphatase [Magnaporthiopsis poae ATCC 64411]
MAFTMHSHSGQFCPSHAKDQLEDVILHAIKLGFKTMGLSEHMPRTQLCDLYPDEIDSDPNGALAALAPRHTAYLAEARRLQAKYAGRSSCWSEGLQANYYDEQLVMLEMLRPRVVGHFDLIRLLGEDPGRDVSKWSPDVVWSRARRNLAFVARYGGWLECNTSALRKGLEEPYPSRPIAEEWLRLGGKFTFSDDSHGIAQLATNYTRGLDYLESLGVTELWTFERRVGEDASKAEIVDKCVRISDFRASLRSGDAVKA